MINKAKNTRALILKTASELFSKHGYQNTTVKQILEKAHISKGGFYHHFNSKEDIIDALAKLQVDHMADMINKISEDRDLSATEKFNMLIDGAQQTRTENRDEIYKLFEAYLKRENLVLKDRIDTYTLKKVKPAYTRIIRQGVDEGVFQTKSPELAAECIIRFAPELRLKMAEIYLNRNSKINFEKDIAYVAEFLEEFVLKILGAKQGSIQIAVLFKSFFKY